MAGIPTAPHLAVPELVEAGVDDWNRYAEAALRGFHEDYDEAVWQRQGDVFEPDRSFGFQRNGRWVATTASYTRRLVVPGGSVPAAAVTLVTVQPTYRRRGLMTAMMRHQLEDVHRRGEPIALLWASEATIYGRFGYGHAAPRLDLRGSTRQSAFRPDIDLGNGSVAEVARDEALSVLPGLRDSWLGERPGHLDRTPTWWEVTLHDPPAWRDGAAALRFALHFAADGNPDGYVVFRVKGAGTGQELSVHVDDVDAADPTAYAALWRFVLDLDLVRTFTRKGPTDDALRHLIADDRSVEAKVVDGSYVRLVDVAAALSGRRYAAPLDVVVGVADGILTHNDGRWQLRTEADTVEVTRVGDRAQTSTGRPADLDLDVRELGTAYLGGVSLTSLARAGLVREHTPGAVALLSVALSSDRAPYCPDPF